MEHFEILTIRTRCLGFQLSHEDHKLILEKIALGLLKIEDWIYNLLDFMEKTKKYFQKQRR